MVEQQASLENLDEQPLLEQVVDEQQGLQQNCNKQQQQQQSIQQGANENANEEVVTQSIQQDANENANEQQQQQQQRQQVQEQAEKEEQDEERVSPSVSAEEEQVGMDQRVWENLPEHVVDIILAWLPLASLLRLRTVCRRWNMVVTSKCFLETCSRVKCRRPYFLMFADHFHRRLAAVYDQEMSKWRFLEFSSFLSCRFPESFLVLASAGGLLCLEGTGSKSGCMFVSNPIARRHRKLPSMIPMKLPYVVGMVVDEDFKSYKILVAQDGEHLESQVYDSRTNSWKLTGVLNRRTAILAGATVYNGLLYCLTFSPNGLLAFDLDNGAWKTVDIAMPLFITCPNLMTHRGKLVLIGGLEELGTLQSVRIWELSSGEEWIELVKLPEDVFKRLFTSSSGHFICVGHGDFVVLHEYYSPEILMFDLIDRSWQWLSDCSMNDNLDARSVLGYAFQPRIEALP